MTEETQTQDVQQRIKSVTVYWNREYVEDFYDVIGLGTDDKLGFPRMSIQDSKGKITNVNLNHVKSWDVEVEFTQ